MKKQSIGSLLIILAIAGTSSVFGQHAIGHRSITFNDPARSNRSIPCEIYYPSMIAGDDVAFASGAFPIIVFGHGFAMQVGAYPNWYEEFVTDGYIMVFPTTEGSFVSPDHGEFGLDLRFLVTAVQAGNGDSGSPFYQHVSARSAIMGHSMGGGATVLAASGFSDVDCIVMLAPAETNPSAITAATDVSAPAMILSGASDGVTPPADHHIPIYNALGSACKYFVSIEDGSHCYFASNTVTCTLGELIPGSLPAEDQRQVSYAVTHPWFDYFLKDSCAAWDNYQTALNAEPDLADVQSDCEVQSPMITDNGSTLTSDAQSNYQWYLNGVEIGGATQQQYAYSQSGTYQVGTVVLGNCPTFSNEIVVQITGVGETEIQVRGVNGHWQLESKETLRNVQLEWLDLSGRVLWSHRVPALMANQPHHVPAADTKGVGLLRLTSDRVTNAWIVY